MEEILYKHQALEIKHEFFGNDIWHLRDRIDYELTKAQEKSLGKNGKLAMNFSDIRNPIIKEEFKHYWYDKIHHKGWKETNMIIYQSAFKELCVFFNEALLKDGSILNSKEETLLFKLKNHLLKKGKSVEVKRGVKLNANNEIVQRTTPVREVLILKKFYAHISTVVSDESSVKDVREKDIWTLQDMRLTEEQVGACRLKSVVFSSVRQEEMKREIKQCLWMEKSQLKLGTIQNRMNCANKFTAFLFSTFPELQSFKQLKRTHIESYFGHVETEPLTQSTKRKLKNDLKVLLERMRELHILKVEGHLFYEEEFQYKIRTKKPAIIPDVVLSQLNEVLTEAEVPVTFMRMLFLIQYIGCRITDMCKMKFGSVSRDSEGDYHIRYFQQKVSKWTVVPIDETIALMVLKQEKETKEKNPDSEYIFLNEHGNQYKQENFSHHINWLAYCYNIVDEHGNLFRFKSHAFRRTKASKMVNEGISPQVVAKVLGHSGVGTLNHYVKISDEKLSEAIQILENYQQEIDDITFEKTKPIEDLDKELQLLLPLPNGFCRSKEECKTAFACYSCPFFKPHIHYIEQYTKQLELAKQAYRIASINGLKRQTDLNEQLIEKIEKVIHKVKK